MKLPSIIIINPHANVRPENATTPPQQQQQVDPLTEIGKVARPLMLNSTASSNITFSGNEDGGVPTTTPSQEDEMKNAPKLYAQKPYNKTIGKYFLVNYFIYNELYVIIKKNM